MGSRYRKCKDLVDHNNIRGIASVSKSLGMPQKITYFTLAVYYRCILMRKSKGIIPTGAACIMLSGKVNGSLRSLDQILRASYKHYGVDPARSFQEDYRDAIDIELHACIAMDFNFDMDDPYGLLEKICGDNNIDRPRAQTMWVVLNDTMYLPLTLCFSIRSIVMSCVLVSDAASGFEDRDSSDFWKKHGLSDINSSDINFISGEIASLYEYGPE